MHPQVSIHEPSSLARAFLALDGADADALLDQRTLPRVALALVVAVVLALGTPLLWATLPPDAPTAKGSATLAPKVSLVAAPDDAGQ
jgi:hypothetical protein